MKSCVFRETEMERILGKCDEHVTQFTQRLEATPAYVALQRMSNEYGYGSRDLLPSQRN